jgi:hypothetical protein
MAVENPISRRKFLEKTARYVVAVAAIEAASACGKAELEGLKVEWKHLQPTPVRFRIGMNTGPEFELIYPTQGGHPNPLLPKEMSIAFEEGEYGRILKNIGGKYDRHRFEPRFITKGVDWEGLRTEFNIPLDRTSKQQLEDYGLGHKVMTQKEMDLRENQISIEAVSVRSGGGALALCRGPIMFDPESKESEHPAYVNQGGERVNTRFIIKMRANDLGESLGNSAENTGDTKKIMQLIKVAQRGHLTSSDGLIVPSGAVEEYNDLLEEKGGVESALGEFCRDEDRELNETHTIIYPYGARRDNMGQQAPIGVSANIVGVQMHPETGEFFALLTSARDTYIPYAWRGYNGNA